MTELLRLPVDIEPQPDDTSCGPTCLHAVYRYLGLELGLADVVAGVTPLPGGGTLEVSLALDALRRGLVATIYTYNLNLFDPTWFAPQEVDIATRLRARAAARNDAKLDFACTAWCDFLAAGGRLRFVDLTRDLLRSLLRREVPLIAALNLTYLYRNARVSGPHDEPDDVHGEALGHFVLLSGYDRGHRSIDVADPYPRNPVAAGQRYAVHIDRVIGAILLGVMTYDASLLLVERAP
ncbi:MAG: hypothetical protein AB7Q81_07330 [Gammaproteobacteria bacterium]